MKSPQKWQLPTKLAPLLIALLIILAYVPLWLKGGFIGDLGDPVGQTIPNKFLLTEYLKNGIFPLWNPFSFLGMPLLADIQVGTFYLPDIAIFSLFQPLTAHNVSILLHLIFAAIGSYFLLRKLSGSSIAAFSLSLSLTLTGSFLTKIVYLNFLETISFLPWLLLALTSTSRPITKSTIIIAFMLFAGHPVAAFYSLIATLIFIAIQNRKRLLHLTVATGLAILISAIQLLPFLKLKSLSVRDNLPFDEFTNGGLNADSLFSVISPLKTGIENPFDLYINFGTIALLLLVASLFFYKKINKKLYFTGLTLSIAGLLFSIYPAIDPLAKFLYNMPFFNDIRVPARYIIISHIGIVIMLTATLAHMLRVSKRLGKTIATLIIINSMLLPTIFLDRHEKTKAMNQYDPVLIANPGDLETPPEYFLSSSFYLFPNRHILSLTPNLIGYNPLILKIFHDIFPVEPVGAFSDPNYFTALYQGISEKIKYYIFPTEEFLIAHNLKEKVSTIDFLKSKNWQPRASFRDFIVWQNPTTPPFASFQNPANVIKKVFYSPNKIILETDMSTPDTLTLNQTYYPGWQLTSDNDTITPATDKAAMQQYEIATPTNTLTIEFKPKEVTYGSWLSLIGLLALGLTFYCEKQISANIPT